MDQASVALPSAAGQSRTATLSSEGRTGRELCLGLLTREKKLFLANCLPRKYQTVLGSEKKKKNRNCRSEGKNEGRGTG